MNIKILDSWLREHLKTDASAKVIAEKLSLSSVSVERLEKHKNDYLYDIEITTNRPDLMSIVGMAREASTVLSQNNIPATFIPSKLNKPKVAKTSTQINIKNDPQLVNRICAVIMEVTVKPTPPLIIDRLEATGMRSLNNLIDITNYVTRTIGHSTHVFDFDRLNTKNLIIRQSKKGEKITTLDNKTHILPGGDIVAVDDNNKIVDLLGIMGLENSVVTDQTKKILFFLDNNDPVRMRKTSMTLSIRSEAVILNEKDTDPELAYEAFLFGIKLFEELAGGKIISPFYDIYPNKSKLKTITVSEQKINSIIGVSIPLEKSKQILTDLGFDVKIQKNDLIAQPPSFRNNDIDIPEDLIEEIARIYGYTNIPCKLPPTEKIIPHEYENNFYWESRAKNALKYWGFTEVYTYSLVSKKLIETDQGAELYPAKPGAELYPVELKNPLDSDHIYMRTSIINSLLEVVNENQSREELKIFELAKVYQKRPNNLPDEIPTLAGIIKNSNENFFNIKGLIDQIAKEMGIKNLIYKNNKKSGADIYLDKQKLGEISILPENIFAFEINFNILCANATMKKTYTPIPKYPPVIEDLALIIDPSTKTGDIIEEIKKQNKLIKEVSLLDKFENTRTFHIIYQSKEKNLTNVEVGGIRAKILKVLMDKFHIRPK